MLAKGTGGCWVSTERCFPQGLFLPGSMELARSRHRTCYRSRLGTCSHRSVALVKAWSPGLGCGMLGVTSSASCEGLCQGPHPGWQQRWGRARRSGRSCPTSATSARAVGPSSEAAGRQRGFETHGCTWLCTSEKGIQHPALPPHLMHPTPSPPPHALPPARSWAGDLPPAFRSKES